ncbi:Uncharacterised protein [Yersinia enterocolitica]|nr:Uncharacterised protein [Yersinia enterocolitica]
MLSKDRLNKTAGRTVRDSCTYTTGQALYGGGCGLNTLLQGAAGAVFLHFVFVDIRVAQFFHILGTVFLGGIFLQWAEFFFCRLQAVNITLCMNNITDLTANLANQLCFAQAVLFFLFIKDGGEGVVGMFDIAAQVIDILLLFIGIAESDSAIRDRRMSGAIVMAFIVGSNQ